MPPRSFPLEKVPAFPTALSSTASGPARPLSQGDLGEKNVDSSGCPVIPPGASLPGVRVAGWCVPLSIKTMLVQSPETGTAATYQHSSVAKPVGLARV